MNMITKLATKMLAVLSVVAMIASPAAAQGLSASDMAFAFGGKAAAPAAAQQTARAAEPVTIASVRGMTQTEMQETEGAWISIPIRIGLQFLGRGGGGRICGVICRTGTSRNSGYGIRMDYAPNPSPTRLHFHAGRLSSGGSWGGHRPWYAPWRRY